MTPAETYSDQPKAPTGGSQDDKYAADGQLAELIDLFNNAEEYYKQDYNLGREDYNFVFGDQWPADMKQLRDRYDRVSLVENRMLPFVHQVVNSFRQTNPAVEVKPVGSGADVQKATLLQGIIRSVEYESRAKAAYARGVFNAVAAARGWVRVRTDYVNALSFDQKAVIEGIIDPNSVYLDPHHKEIDGSDARYGFIIDSISKKEFKEQYGYEPDGEFTAGDAAVGWVSDKDVRVAEAFCKKFEKRKLVKTISGVYFEGEQPPVEEILETRETQIPTIKWYLFTCDRILEESEWVGQQYIPIIPFYGLEAFLDGKRCSRSLVNPAKDPQRMYNYWKSCSTEVIALQPRAPFIAAEGQISEKYASDWANAHKTNPAVLFYRPMVVDGVPVGRPEREAPPVGSISMLQEANMAAEAIKATLGIYDASLGVKSNEVSGVALQNRQQQTDNAVFHFWDNVRASIAQVGRVLLDIIPSLYTAGRSITLLGEKDEPTESIVLPQDFTLQTGEYDIVVTTGAAFATQRQEAVAALLQLTNNQPELAKAVADVFVRNLDIPDAKLLEKRLKAVMDPAILADDPTAVRLQQAMQMVDQLKAALDEKTKNTEFEQQLEAQRLGLDKEELAIKAAETRAKIAKIMSEIKEEGETPNNSEAYAQAMMELQQQIMDVAQAVNVIITAKEIEDAGEEPAMMQEVNETVDTNPQGV